MILMDFNNYTVLFKPGTPTKRANFTGTPVPVNDLLQAIEATDKTFPLRRWNPDTKKWSVFSNTIDEGTGMFVWGNAVFSGHTLLMLFRQGGWDLPLLHWESLPNADYVVDDDVPSAFKGNAA